MGLFLVGTVLPASAAERVDPATECTAEDRGPYPRNYREIVKDHITRTFYDPGAVVDLDIYKPSPDWWSTAAFGDQAAQEKGQGHP